MKISATQSSLEDNLNLLHDLEANQDPKWAKRWGGRKIFIDVNKWNQVSEKRMRRALYLKFTQHPELMKKLVDTAGTELIEYNTWGDTLWGVDKISGRGQNKLGKLLMELRENQQVV